MASPKINALEQITKLQEQIAALQESAVSELRAKRNALLQELEQIDQQIEEITGKPAEGRKASKPTRTRRPSVNDEELRTKVLEVMSQHGKGGLNMKQIGEYVDQSPIRIKKFIADNPKVLKRQGTGPATKFFLP